MIRIRSLLYATLALSLLGLGLAQQRGGTLVAAWEQDPVGLDPHVTSARSSFQILENVLDTLVEMDAELNVVPALATSWSVDDSGTVWTFQLRDGVTFHNGRAMTAEDVAFTYGRMLDPAVASGNAYKLGGVVGVRATGDLTVEMTLGAPSAIFLSRLALDKSLGIIARESVDDGTINTAPVGTGPFAITEYLPGTSLTLTRNADYWKTDANGVQLPYLDAVEIRIVGEGSQRRTALVTGDVDWAFSVPLQSVAELQGRNDVVVDSTAGPAYFYMGVNTQRAPLDDVRVRQAISYALDRGQITEAATFGTGVATQDPIPSVSGWAYDYAPYDQDLDKARALLAEAGVAGGFELTVMPTTFIEETIRMAQVIQAQLAPLGITVSIDTREWSDWLETQGAGNYDTFVCSWNGLVDPDDFFYAQHKTGEGFNFTGYSNPAVDLLLEAGRVAADPNLRRDIYEVVNEAIVDAATYIYIYNPSNIQAYRTNVKGYAARADQAIQFVGTWLE